MPSVFEAQQGSRWVWSGGSEGERGGDEGREVTSWCLLLCLSPYLTVAPFGQGRVCLVSPSMVPATEWVPVTCLLNE